jgi:hypothetical protein
MTELLKDHFNSTMFRWRIYHHHQGENFTLKAGTQLVNSFLLCTHYVNGKICADFNGSKCVTIECSSDLYEYGNKLCFQKKKTLNFLLLDFLLTFEESYLHIYVT